MHNIVNLQFTVHMEMLNLQRIYRYICSDKFMQAHNLATEEDLNRLKEYIQIKDKDMIKKWVKGILKKDYESYNMMELRHLGKKLGIRNYQTITRDNLLGQIIQIMEME